MMNHFTRFAHFFHPLVLFIGMLSASDFNQSLLDVEADLDKNSLRQNTVVPSAPPMNSLEHHQYQIGQMSGNPSSQTVPTYANSQTDSDNINYLLMTFPIQSAAIKSEAVPTASATAYIEATDVQISKDPSRISVECARMQSNCNSCFAHIVGLVNNTAERIGYGLTCQCLPSCKQIKSLFCCNRTNRNQYSNYDRQYESHSRLSLSTFPRLCSTDTYAKILTVCVLMAVPVAILATSISLISVGSAHGAQIETYPCTRHGERTTCTSCIGASAHYCNMYDAGSALLFFGIMGTGFMGCVIFKAFAGVR